MEKKAIKIVFNGKTLIKSKLSGDKILSDIREEIKDKVQQKFYFYDADDVMIDEKDENETKLNEILDEKNNAINIKSLVPNIEIGKPTRLNIKPENKPMENAKYIKNIGNLKIYQYPDIKFTVNEEATCQIVLVVGQTGSGKTTFINAYLNYLMGIDLDDEFRYFLIVEDDKQRKSASQTKGLHIYNIRSKNMTIKIVDTQGFGDTAGPKEDEKITNTIKDAFMNELNSINTICFIVKSSDSRLTNSQKYIFSSIISLFGQDIKSNFLSLITFYDGNEPAAIETLKTSDFKEIIPFIKEPWYLKFNSNLLFSKNNDNALIRAGWEEAKNNYKILNNKILSLGRQSLTQSKENLDLREKIQININALQELLKKEVNSLQESESQKKYIQEHEKEINTKIITKIPKIVKIEEKKEQDYKSTTCKICKFNCHRRCADTALAGYDLLKFFCKAWDWSMKCTVCPNHCDSNCHELTNFTYEERYENDFIEVEELCDDYEKKKNLVKISKDMIKKLEEDIKGIKNKINGIQTEIREKSNELRKIALSINNYQTTIEFLEEQIEQEKKTMTDNWKERIKVYEEMIKENEDFLKYSKINVQNDDTSKKNEDLIKNSQ